MATAKKTVKTAAKPAPRKTAAGPVKSAKAAEQLPKATAPAAPPKPLPVNEFKKPKLVRDSFTIPKTEYAVLEVLKQRAMKAGSPAKKSELLRAGIKALAIMPDAAFLTAISAVPAIKTGRPNKA